MLFRFSAAKEIMLCKKMLQVLEMAKKRKDDAVKAGVFTEDLCSYDGRLEEWGVQGQKYRFERFLNSPEGEEIMRTGKLHGTIREATIPPHLSNGMDTTSEALVNGDSGPAAAGSGLANGHANGEVTDKAVLTSGMCGKRRCKAHHGWYMTHTRHLRYTVKLLAREAREHKEREREMLDAANERALRKRWMAETGDTRFGGKVEVLQNSEEESGSVSGEEGTGDDVDSDSQDESEYSGEIGSEEGGYLAGQAPPRDDEDEDVRMYSSDEDSDSDNWRSRRRSRDPERSPRDNGSRSRSPSSTGSHSRSRRRPPRRERSNYLSGDSRSPSPRRSASRSRTRDDGDEDDDSRSPRTRSRSRSRPRSRRSSRSRRTRSSSRSRSESGNRSKSESSSSPEPRRRR